MIEYLCYVITVTHRTPTEHGTRVLLSRVLAINKDEAVGKFLRHMRDVPRIETLLPVTCIPMSSLTPIK